MVWKETGDQEYILTIEPYDDEVITIAKLWMDKETEGWMFSSEILNYDEEDLGTYCLEEAKGDIVEKAVEYYEDIILHYKTCLNELVAV